MIPLGDPRRGSTKVSGEEMEAARERAAKMAQSFPAQSHGFLAGYGAPVQQVRRVARRSAEIDVPNSQERRARLDRLPAEVRRKAADKGYGNDLLLMETVAHVHRASARNGGFSAPIVAADIAHALRIETPEADALLEDAIAVGLLRCDRKSLNGGNFSSLV